MGINQKSPVIRGGLLRLFAPVDIAALVYFRVAFGAIMVWEVWRYFSRGWVEAYYVEPVFYFKYFGFEWVQPWPGQGMIVHFVVMGALAACVMTGLFYRAAAAGFFLAFTYVFLLDQTHYLNHHYLVCLIALLMVFIPTHRAFSLDALRNPALRSQIAPAWALWLLRGQIGLVYFFGGVAKLNGDWLAGEPMRMWLAERMDFPLIGHLFTQEWMVFAFSAGGLLFDLLFFPLVLWRRTRWFALIWGAVFHLTNWQLFSIGIFPWFMLAANLIFLDPGWPRKLLNRRDARTDAEQHPYPVRRLVIAGLGLYFAAQIVLPLRHFMYPGDVNWTEEGHRFSWHMKLRDKDSVVRFFASDPAGGTRWEIDVWDTLHAEQVEEMSGRPDMIVQFAHYAAGQLREQYPQVEIRAWVEVSLNGRAPQLLINPAANLAALPRTLTASDWILPLAEGRGGGFSLLVSAQPDHLVVVNLTDGRLPLTPLRLGNGEQSATGGDWAVEWLEQDECVVLWNSTPGLPAAPCNQTGALLTREGAAFWQMPFDVYYGPAHLATCASSACVVRF